MIKRISFIILIIVLLIASGVGIYRCTATIFSSYPKLDAIVADLAHHHWSEERMLYHASAKLRELIENSDGTYHKVEALRKITNLGGTKGYRAECNNHICAYELDVAVTMGKEGAKLITFIFEEENEILKIQDIKITW